MSACDAFGTLEKLCPDFALAPKKSIQLLALARPSITALRPSLSTFCADAQTNSILLTRATIPAAMHNLERHEQDHRAEYERFNK